jgi:hypothetical protein
MSWDKLDIHLENLVPGLATLWAISLHWKPPAADTDAGKIVLGIALLGAAYVAGVLTNILCRMLLDPLSEHWTRIYAFKIFARDKLRDLKGASRKEANDAYNYYCTRAIQEAKDTAKEVSKRRQTARLLRSALVPIVILQLHWPITDHIGWDTIGIVLIEYLFLLFIYGYSEVTILHEAYHSVPENERSVSKIKKILADRRKAQSAA